MAKFVHRLSNPTWAIQIADEELETYLHPVQAEDEAWFETSEDTFLTRDMSQEERDAFLAAKAAEDKAANDAAEAEAVEDAAEVNEVLEGETGTASVDVVMTHNPDAEADLV